MTFEQLFPSLRPAVEHLGHAWPGVAVKPFFAEWEIVHVLCLAILGGASILLNLRLAGAGLSGEPASEVERNVRPWSTAAVIGVLVSGVLMATSNAERLYTSPAFTAKMAALLGAVILTYGVAMPIARAEGRASGRVKLAFAMGAAVSLLALWLFATGALVSPGLVHVLVAAALIYAFIARGRRRWIFAGGLVLLTAAEFVLTHLVVGPGDAERSDPINLVLVVLAALWTLGFVLVQVLGNRAAKESSPIGRIAGYATMLVWVMAAAAGRWIAYG